MSIAADPVLGQWGIRCPEPPNLKGFLSHTPPLQDIDIIDIRQAAVEIDLKADIHVLFNSKSGGAQQFPTLLLYDERGLQLFEKITYLEQYYLTDHEIRVLERSAVEIANAIPSGSMVMELGSGNLRKVILLLQTLEKAGKSIDYYALDLSRKELERTLAHVPDFKHVRCHGLHGTYDDGREWLKTQANLTRQKCLLTLGSSIGNFERDEAISFLRSIADVLRPTDLMLIGLDACQDPEKVFHAYNDREGTTHQFILNGLTHANRILGEKVFDESQWRVIGEYMHDGEGGRHQAFYSPTRDTVVLGTVIKSHSRIQVERSIKYSRDGAARLWKQSGLMEVGRWDNNKGDYGLHLLAKATMPFSLLPSIYAGSALPSIEDWVNVWGAWDLVTKDMLPGAELLKQPIRLRNACIFYLGHIPTFLDILLSKTTGGSLTEPAWFRTIFERGIDPDVDNPERCHDHSEIPSEWPPLEVILTYQDRVRSRLQQLYADNGFRSSRKIGRAIWVGFEHELMHIETLLYMMLQSNKTLPPPNAPHPDFEKLAEQAAADKVQNQWFTIPQQRVTIGLDDPEEQTDLNCHYGWDNEGPSREVNVHSFQAQGRPITNEEYARFIHSQGISTLPACWSQDPQNNTNANANGRNNSGRSFGDDIQLPQSFLHGKSVKTVYGPVPLQHALDWPIFASYDELSACAAWMGGRIPTFEEARSIYQHVNVLKKEKAERTLGKTVPAVNGHLINNGVQETPPTTPPCEVSEEYHYQQDLFTNLDGANVGFQYWHPLPVTGNGGKLAGQSELGGVWEWTSSILEKHDGFQPLSLYPEYTADFFDGKHNIVLGGSWATHPRIAGRKSFINWYQRNYPYAWVGARLVRDLS